ncbi:hypothetical protein ACFQYP_23480 [Nonomuraea antimicrobica]
MLAIGDLVQRDRRRAGQRPRQAEQVEVADAAAGPAGQRLEERRRQRRGQVAGRDQAADPAGLHVGEDHRVGGEGEHAHVAGRGLGDDRQAPVRLGEASALGVGDQLCEGAHGQPRSARTAAR